VKTHIHAATAIIDGEDSANICVEVSHGLISAISSHCNSQADHSVSGTLIPGFVDIHCHGGGGFYFSDTNTANIKKARSVHQ
jgi:N-acetylglucosamine-6-phosphate deacetylase